MFKVFRHCWWLIAALLPVTSWCQDALTLQAAVERSLKDNPELKAVGFALAAQEGRIEQARARPALELSAEVEDALGSGDHKGFDEAETTLSVGWVWERGARQARVDAGQAGLGVVNSEAQIKRLDIATETARRFITALALQQKLEELHRVTQWSEETHATVKQRVAAAKAPSAEEARAFAALVRARLNEEDGEHELLTAKVRLAAMWGAIPQGDQPTIDRIAGDVLQLAPVEEFAVLRARLNNNPERARLLTTQRLRESEVTLAQARSRLPWRFNAGVRHLESTSDHAFVFGMTAPLSNSQYTRGALAEARAEANRTQAELDAQTISLQAELYALWQELRHGHTETEALRDQVLPRMAEALEQSRYAYERGRYGYADLTAAQRELAEVRRDLIEAAAYAHRYRIEIERLTGATLPNTTP
jgi:outer membrane protein, heavy metal efflux system